MKLLVTGGAGYIGSVVAAMALREGHQVAVLDDLSTGHADAVPAGAAFVEGSVRYQAQAVLADGVDAVLHLAAKSLVPESVAKPALYWKNNLGGTLALLEAMRVTGVSRIVFSSTAAVYGEPEHTPIDEAAPTRPANPYGASKLAVDTALDEHARMHKIGAISLRYFNVAGAQAGPGGKWLGERHNPETHLIPSILAVALGGSGNDGGASGTGADGGNAGNGTGGDGSCVVRLFGDDYPTPDGTCIRDYIHVTDLARAHMLALEACVPGEHRVYNLGSGAGFSNLEVLGACREVTGRDIPCQLAPRRPGDPAVLVASSDRIHADLGWRAERGLAQMVADAWQFTLERPALGHPADSHSPPSSASGATPLSAAGSGTPQPPGRTPLEAPRAPLRCPGGEDKPPEASEAPAREANEARGAAVAERAAGRFRAWHGAEPQGVWHAPGRANLMGEHTDYNEGWVLPFALDRGVVVAAARRDDDVLDIRSHQADGPVTVPLATLRAGSVTGWAAYPAGVAWALREAGLAVGGASLVIDSNLPQGAGLSSSAAIECATAIALASLYRVSVTRPELATLARRAENEMVGVPSGIMDQSASLLSETGHALLLDCRAGDSTPVPLDPAASGLALLLVDTGVRRALTDGRYALRRRECEQAARALGVRSLRDVDDPARAAAIGDPVLARRARHVISDNCRVRAAVNLLQAHDLAGLGPLLHASHASLRDDFEISWPEANVAAEAAERAGGLGARMMGGGFGGSVLALVPADSAGPREAIVAEYTGRGWPAPRFLPAPPSAGARRLL